MRWHGVLGLLLIILVELNFYFKIEPFSRYYFPFIWIGYILLIDALVYRFSDSSLLMKDRKKFLWLFVMSAVIWWLYELVNIKVGNWSYSDNQGSVGLFSPALVTNVYATVSFATVLPAIFETYDLVKALHAFDHIKLRASHALKKPALYAMILLGVLSLGLPMIRPDIFYPLVWLSFFFLLDPINYLRGEPSMIEHLQCRNLKRPAQLAFAGLFTGFFWEFWNYWAPLKWKYDVPYVGFLKIFEMPLLGYLGYLPFALSLYSMYYFTRHYFKKALYARV